MKRTRLRKCRFGDRATGHGDHADIVLLKEARSKVIRYIHRNPVKRGLVAKPEDWAWSSFRHYATGIRGVVEIESEWTARLRPPLIAIMLR